MVFDLEALQAHEKLTTKRTGEKITSWSEYIVQDICGDGVPVDSCMESDDSLCAEKEKEKEEETKQLQKKAKTSTKPKEVPAPMKPKAPVTDAGTPGKRRRKVAEKKSEVQQKDNFLRNEPSPGAVTRDVICRHDQ